MATRLADNGLSVWWDTELVGGEAFRDTIEEQLKAAKVVMVLWSPNAVASRFVVDEADVAAATGKLVSVLLDGFKAKQTPIGFRSYQAVPIEDQQGIERALQRRGLTFAKPAPAAAPAASFGGAEQAKSQAQAPPQAAPQSPPVEQLDEASREEEAWKFVLAKQDDKLVADFLKEFPNSKYVNEAKSRKRYMDRRAVLGLIILFGMVVGAVFGTAGAFLGVPEGIIGLFVGLGVGFLGTVFTVIPINALFFGDPDKALKQQEHKFLKKP